MEKPVLIFDHDGTLHDSMHVFGPAMHAAEDILIERGYDITPAPDEVIASCMGLNSHDMWEKCNYNLTPELVEEMVPIVGRKVGELLKTGIAKWFDGTDEMLDVLKEQGYHMVILSNCEKNLADFYWKHFKMEKWFDKFYETESYDYKPKTEIVKYVLQDYGSGIMIGDRFNDMECARAGGIPFIGCLYGFGEDGELDGADALAERPSDIPDKVNDILGEI